MPEQQALRAGMQVSQVLRALQAADIKEPQAELRVLRVQQALPELWVPQVLPV